MKKNYPNLFFLGVLFLVCLFSSKTFSQSFAQSQLNFNGFGDVSSGVTSLMYGPDGRLYVAEYPGTIKILTIQRNGPTDYEVTAVETLSGVKDIVNHDDDGQPCSGTTEDCSSRETTGLTVAGTASNPIIYVTSSDFRIGSGPGGGNGDVGLDTNSGVITRFTWTGSDWDVVDIVRGLPRSEENHATNGLEVANINGTEYLLVASGGITNGGSPSTNFVYTCEYALSGAILSVDLDAINALPVQTDGDGRQYLYDLPTLDDPTRANANGIEDPDTPGYDGIDVNDPWGGNDGLNQAIVYPTGPVQIYSPGYRNAYDIVLTESGALYATDNGANPGWGGLPFNEGIDGTVTNAYDPTEPGNQSPTDDGEQIDNKDHLQLITTDVQTYVPGSLYGGHPNPTRANPTGAGLYTDNGTTQVFRTLIYDPDGSTPGSTTDASIGLPANWPPVPTAMANPVEGDWRGPSVPNPDGPNDDPVVIWGTNTNGIDEYTASNFSGAMQGDLLAGHNGGNIRRAQLEPDGSLQNLTSHFFSGLEGNPLGITCNGDDEIFPGTVWAGTLNGLIKVFEPQDFVDCIEPGEAGYDPLADSDFDGYTNQDEEDNGTQVCNGGSQPDDFDKSAGAPLVSNLNDPDDDNDGISDAMDPFQLGNPLTTGSDAFELPVNNDLFNDQQGLGGIFGLGMTGLMNNGDTGANWLDWLDDRDNGPNPNDVLGGAPGIMTSHMTDGTALGTSNDQDKGYQYGVQVDNTTGKFTVIGGMNGFTGPLRLYENTNGVTGGELGFFIGDGTQSNYIKFVVTTDGFTALQEINDVPGTPIEATIALGDRPTSGIRFYFVVDPVAGTVDLEYQIDSNSRTPLGQINATGTILQAIQTNGLDLAVGFIGTSNTSGKELEGSWDFLNVMSEEPILVQEIPDLDKMVDTADEDIDLDNYFNDDEGVANLTYSVEGNTDPSIGAVINGNILTLSYPATEAVTNITIRATDNDANFVEDIFTVNVTEGNIVLYRVNSGGVQITAIDGGIDWEEDTKDNNSQYLSSAASNSSYSGNITTTDGSVDTDTTPTGIFEKERYDNSPGAPNLKYSFPVAEPGNYEVRLYMGDGFSGTAEAGERIFDVTIEGVALPLLTDIDLSGTYGSDIGTMITHTVAVNDGILDIEFLHGVIQNPLINGIEILDAPDTDTPIYVFDIADQFNNAGEELSGGLGVQARGGDGNLQYSATGLPPGVILEPTNGQIGGTIADDAFNSSPYNVTITVDDSDGLTNDATAINFTWVVVDPYMYRINAGGAQITATDMGIKWEDDLGNGAQTGVSYSVNTGLTQDYTLILSDNRDSSIPAYIDDVTFESIFNDERYDESTAPEMEYTLPVEDGDYVVHLYLGNSWDTTNDIGERVFDILIEGALVENDLDLVERFGHQIGGMLSYPATVNDGALNISFGHVTENPLVNAIEVYLVDSANPTFALSNISDQTNGILDTVDFMASTTGGDDTQDVTYYMTGQPDGITIDSSTGQISGTINVSAATGGPNANGTHSVMVTAVKPLSAPSSFIFTWTVEVEYLWTDKDEDESYTARHENSFVQAGDKFYLMGGRENATSIDVYDYTNDSWTELTSITPTVDGTQLEFNHFQAIEYKGLIWVIGAFKSNTYPNEVPAEYVWMFDPANQEWIQGPQIPAGRRRGSAGLAMYNDKFYIVGGNDDGHDGGYVAQFDEYDPATGAWTVLTDAPRARDHFSAVMIGDKLYAAGGRLSGGPDGAYKPVIAEVDVYDFSTGTWSTLPSEQNIPTPRGGTAAVNFNDRLVVMGGEVRNEIVYGVSTDDALPITEEYDPVTQTWDRLADMNHERQGFQAIVSGPGIHVLAGSPNRGGGNQKNMEYLGEDSPVGTPIDGSVLSAPTTVVISDGETVDIDLDVIDGNTGLFISSMEITGADAADYSIDSGELSNVVLNANSSHSLSVTLSGTGTDRTATLTINYGGSNTLNITLTNNPDVAFGVTNPGDQYNYEGDAVSLQIEATSPNNTTYSATGLPPSLSINENTGIITGTIDEGFLSGGGDSFLEENGLVIIEAESGDTTGWDITNADGETGIIANTNSFNSINGNTISYDITIGTPGVYRFDWKNFFSGPTPADENDSWLRFPNNDDVWFFGIDASEPEGSPANEAEIIANLQGAQSEIVFPIGSSRITASTTPEGAGSNGYFKVYRSGGASETYDWQARTSDSNNHNIYVWFVNPGTYTMEVSERSSGHAIDRMALYKVDTYGYNYSTTNLDNAPESQGGSTYIAGAAENSPYNVSVTVTDDGDPAGNETVDFVWYIGEPGDLIAVPQADVVTGIVPLTVNFTGSNSLDDIGVTSYLWSFNDGTGSTSIEADPSYEFTKIGIYTVDLMVGDDDGNFDTKSITIDVTGTGIPPIAVASSDVIEGEAPLEVVFDASGSTDDIVIESYSWEFGDGGSSIEANPTYYYDNPGIYTVILTVTDIEGLTSTDEITITVTQSPVAVVTATPESGIAPLEVAFTGSGSTDDVGIVTYAWDFMDGGTSAEADPTYIFTAPGTYDVELTVTDDDELTNTGIVTITVSPNDAPLAMASATPESGIAPLEVAFTGSGSTDDVGVVSYAWDFIDGGTSTEADPTYTFDTPGTYEVTLTVTDAGGLTNVDTITVQVNEPGSNEAPVAVASANPTEGQAPLAVIFNGSGSTDDVGIVTYFWDFKDGTTSNEINPVTSFEMAGTYEVSLTVTDEEGLTDTAMVTIQVTESGGGNEAPVADASATPMSGDAPLEVSFTGSNSTDDVGVVSYAWDFNDGGSSTEANPTYTFNAVGTYQVMLTVTDEEGLTDTDTVTIEVTEPSGGNEAPVADASATPMSGDTPLEVSFTGSNSTDDVGVVSYAWDFNDGSSSTEADPTYTFNEVGIYQVTLTVTDAEGLMDSATITIEVTGNEAPVAVATATPEFGDAPLEVSFIGSNSTDDVEVVSYAWDFDDGGSSTEADPTHIFEVAESYEVTLTVTDAEGLTDATSITIEVMDNAPSVVEMTAIVAPNPVRDGDDYASLQVKNVPNGAVVTKINLHDSIGRLMESLDPELVDGEYRIPIYMLRDGLYYITVELSQGDPIGIEILVQN